MMVLLSLFQLPVADASGRGGSRQVTKNEAVKAARAKFPGKVVKISNAKKYFNVRVLQKNGRVITVKVDKKTGKVSR
jgi:uncharacterized membrane protein YkoI